MPTKTTREQIDNLAQLTSELLPADTSLEIQAENGGYSLHQLSRTSVVKTLTHGTKTEVWDYLHAFREGIFLSQGR